MRASLFALILLLAPLSASATFHLWQVTEVYSNASGSVQFVELFVNADFQDRIGGHNLTSNSTTYPVPNNLGTTSTANHNLLFATPGFARLPGAVPPDFTLPAWNFMSTVADTINWAGVDTLSFVSGELPTDGVNSLNESFGTETRTTAANSPTNFAGQVGSLPEPSAWLAQLAGSAAVVALTRSRRTRRRPGEAASAEVS